MKFFKSKTFKYGSAAVTLTVAVIAIVVAVNLIVSALSDHFGWYFDTSASGLFSFSDKSLDRLDRIDRENNRLTLCYFADENTLASSDYGNYVLTLTKQLETRYRDDSFITVEHLDNLDRDILEIRALFGDKYADTFEELYEEGQFVPGTMVIRNDTYELGADGEFVTDLAGNYREDYRIRVFSIADMYSSSGRAFLGEYRLTSHIVNVCSLSPTAYFLTGHGEMTIDEDGTYGQADYLVDLFESAGFTVRKLNLGQADFSNSTVEPSVAVIFGPKNDFTAEELSRLSAFVEKGGDLMLFADGTYYKLDNLNAFLSSYGAEIVNAKFKSGSDSSLSVDGFQFAARPDGEQPVLTAIEDRSGRLVVADCRVLRADSEKGAEALAYPPASAQLTGAVTEAAGNEAVALYSKAEGRGSVFVSGTTTLASSLIYEPGYLNRDLLLSVLTDMGAEGAPLNMEINALAADGLDITRSQSILYSVLLSVLPALLFAAAGVVVYVRRKRS